MADDVTVSAVTHGLTLISGGGLAGVFVRMLFGGFGDKIQALGERLDKMEANLQHREERSDKRHDELVGAIAEVKKLAEAAHNRLDIYVPKSRRR